MKRAPNTKSRTLPAVEQTGRLAVPWTGMGKFIAEQTIKHMIAAGSYIKGAKVNVLGLTFKPNTDDIREAPALYTINKLLLHGAKIKAFDPEAMENVAMIYGDKIELVAKMKELVPEYVSMNSHFEQLDN